MFMTGEKFFILEENPRSPSENLAVNKIYSEMMRGDDLDFMARVYSHTNGIILGNTQSVFDLKQDYCQKNDYEIVRRPTGGSVIPVDPESTLCYSLFFNTKPTNLNLTRIYKSITIPLAKNLGSEFSVEGTYYLRYTKGDQSYPLAGHAIRSSRGCVQFDGVINLTPLDVNKLSKMIKLRELYEKGHEKIIRMNGINYTPRGRKRSNFNNDQSELIRSEEKELRKLLGLYDLGYSKTDFIKALEKTVDEVFGKTRKTGFSTIPKNQIKQAQESVKKELNKGKRICLGHCFIDMLEPEPKIHYKK